MLLQPLTQLYLTCVCNCGGSLCDKSTKKNSFDFEE